MIAATARQNLKKICREFAASLPRRGKLAANCRGKLQFLL
jgi:ribosomal protein L40E